MTSSVTDSFRRHLLNEFKKEVDSSGVQYYMGLAKSYEFVEGEDTSSLYFQSQLRHNMQSIKALANNSFVVPHIKWTTGVAYSQYDETDSNELFYVINSSNEVFVCIQTGRYADGTIRPSIIEPTSGNEASSFKTDSDGYIWRQIAILSNVAISNFITSDWMPIKTITDQSANLSISQDSDQRDLQNLSIHGEIINLAIDSGGYGYTTPPTITITGNGTLASFTCNVNAGKIVRINIDSDNSGTITGHGSGYDYASVRLSEGDAVIRPVIGPRGGINADPVKTLKSKSLMLQTDFRGNESNTIQATSEFNQTFLLKDPTEYGSSSAFSGNTGNALKSFTVSSVIGSWSENMLFSDLGGTVKGKVFYYMGSTLYYYQDEETGFDPFVAGPIVSVNNGAITATIDAIINPDFDAYSGEILYINNINTDLTTNETVGITRVSSQTEDTKVIIQLG